MSLFLWQVGSTRPHPVEPNFFIAEKLKPPTTPCGMVVESLSGLRNKFPNIKSLIGAY